MGRHFGIGNRTTKHKVSEGTSCWKGYEDCECHAVMHLYGWKPTDDIFSAAYDTYCEFEYDEKTNAMKCVDKTNEIYEQSDNVPEKNEEQKEIVTLNLGFYPDDNLPKDAWDHAPKWKDGKCSVCNYEFKPKKIDEDSSKFVSLFCMN